jgi:dsRNA-specific ribonuclease
MDLHNYLQKTYKSQTTLTWAQRQLGPEHYGDWEAVACSTFFFANLLVEHQAILAVNHQPYGSGTAHNLDKAKKQVAHQALVNL